MTAPRTIVYFTPRGAGTGARTLRVSIGVSALLHIAALALLVIVRSGKPQERPPAYRVELIGAAGMQRRMGVVAEPAPVETPITKAPAPAAAERPVEPPKVATPKPKAKPIPKPKQATPNVSKTTAATAQTAAKPNAKAAPPVAGSGNKTGKGTDVTNMVSDGIDFPYPGYLNQIVRQIKLNFQAPPVGTLLVAEVHFLIHRDGSVTDIQVTKRSGSSAFDREAIGAVEAAGTSRAFGALPSAFPDDVLPVYFTFSPEKPPA
ncbi:MAG: TonB C-terminal domain-containing protein [Gemmatimonadota bacterium]|nr:TonB C-terminal domain-containing protein [Gemmatimonadota bacterium]